MTWREAHQRAMFAAAEAHDELEVDPTRRIDVFSVIEGLDLALLFRPLRGVSGLYVPGAEDLGAGILVTSNHRLARQRFTAAHELAHHWLQHQASIDVQTEVLARDQLDRLRPDEMVAEAFAAWFLMPPELVDSVREELGMERPQSPRDVYALSLRLGTSYEATAYHLPNLKLATYDVASQWASRPPKEVKELLSLGTPMETYYPDVWALEARDADAEFEVQAGDRLVLTLPEIPSSGFMWSAERMPDTAHVVADTMTDHLGQSAQTNAGDQAPGAAQHRTVIVDIDPEATGELDLALNKVAVWAPASAEDQYRVHLRVRQPLLGRLVAA